MKPSLVLSKLSAALIVVAVVATTSGLTACYEGYKHPGNGPGQGKPGGGAGPGEGEKTYGLALIDVISPNGEAMQLPACGGVPSSLVELRLSEIDARVKSLSALIEAKSDQLRVISTQIGKDDCQGFQTLETRASTALPDPDVADAIKAKPALHVRLVVWFGDTSRTHPSSAVLNSEWSDMQRMSTLGFARRLSVNYFAVIGGATGGYTWTWQRRSEQNLNFSATVVNDPPPTDQGVRDVMTSVQASAAAFADWLVQRTSGI